MNAKSALKKLAKSSKRRPTSAQRHLKRLRSSPIKLESQNTKLRGIPQELKAVSGDVLSAAAAELSAPLNPVLSWFNEAPVPLTPQFQPRESSSSSAKRAKRVSRNPKSALQPRTPSHLAMVPFKSPPCKKCPAKQGAMCHCAMKKYGMR